MFARPIFVALVVLPGAFAQGLITTVAGTDKLFPVTGVNALATSIQPYGTSAVDRAGNLYFVDNSVNEVLRLSPSGTITAGNRPMQ